MPGFHAGRPPRNKGLRYPADPPKVEEIIAVMRAAGDQAHARRLRGLIVILWRAGLRIQEALELGECDLDQRRGAVLVRRGKGGRRREVGMDSWGWEELQPWLELRLQMPIGPLLCVINGPTRGRPWSSAAARVELRRAAVLADASRPSVVGTRLLSNGAQSTCCNGSRSARSRSFSHGASARIAGRMCVIAHKPGAARGTLLPWRRAAT